MKRILWISMSLPNNLSAGQGTFKYYVESLANNNSITLIAKAKENEKYNKDKFVETHIYYPQKGFKRILEIIMSINSKVNPFYKYTNAVMGVYYRYIFNTLIDLENKKKDYDVIILEWTQMVLCVNKIKRLFPNAYIIASEHDVTYYGLERQCAYYSGIRRLISKIRYSTTKKNEIKSLKSCDYIFLHNSDYMSKLTKEGIAAQKMSGLCPYFHNYSNVNRNVTNNDIIFFGAMSRKENYLSAIWFIENVMPELDDKFRFIIIGGNPDRSLKKYENSRVIITGFVEDIGRYFENSLCFVSPLLLGAGIKVKILEAMSSGITVLTNDIGIEGINAKNQIDYFHCINPIDYIKAINILSNNSELNYQIGSSGKRFIENNFNMHKSLNKYEYILKNIESLDSK